MIKNCRKKTKDINVRTDYGLTFFLRTPRDMERAIKEYQISLDIDPNHELTLQNLAIAYKEKNDTENLQKTSDTLKRAKNFHCVISVNKHPNKNRFD